MAVTKIRNIRCDPDLWDRASARASDADTTLSDLIRGWLEDYADAGVVVASGRRSAGKVRLSAAERTAAADRVAELLGDPKGIVDATVAAINETR
jgi:hypothetical protein